MSKFRQFWQQHFPDCPPVSYLFKHRLADRWFRFHSLPESKRYADNETEVTELLARQNSVLLDVIGTNSECFLVSGNYADSPFSENLERCPTLGEFEFEEFIKLSKQVFDPEELEADEEPVYLTLFYAAHNLKNGSLDEILLCIANERIYNTFVINCEAKRIFAPYDGGVDVILKDSNERNEFKLKYKNWLSSRPDGL